MSRLGEERQGTYEQRRTGRVIISDAMRAYQNDSRYLRVAEPHDELRRIAARLDEPIRVAIAGTLNAGKSTLVNALVGEDIAPTDATEATRIVAWFRHGAAPRVTANLFSGVRQDIPIRREEGFPSSSTGWTRHR